MSERRWASANAQSGVSKPIARTERASARAGSRLSPSTMAIYAPTAASSDTSRSKLLLSFDFDLLCRNVIEKLSR